MLEVFSNLNEHSAGVQEAAVFVVLVDTLSFEDFESWKT